MREGRGGDVVSFSFVGVSGAIAAWARRVRRVGVVWEGGRVRVVVLFLVGRRVAWGDGCGGRVVGGGRTRLRFGLQGRKKKGRREGRCIERSA